MLAKDEEAALAAIKTLRELSDDQKDAKSKIDSILLNADEKPHVDIQELFDLYNILYFRSLLLPWVEVSWSSRLTLCSGMCELVKDDEGKYRRIRLKLSEPLLKFRPREDTINTLLHEAIHAYFFVTTSWWHSRGEDGTGHCVGFVMLADAINDHGNYLITVYHTFHDEVDSYRTHVWQCDGPCRDQPPNFGLVKRTMNRPPGKTDNWWEKHTQECGGTYTKIMEPELTKAQLNSLSAMARAGRQKNKLDSWVKSPKKETSAASTTSKSTASSTSISSTTSTVLNASTALTASTASTASGSVTSPKERPMSLKRWLTEDTHSITPPSKQKQVACPICDERISEKDINTHLDSAHPP